MLKIFIPEKKGIHLIAANEFASLWKKVTGKTLAVTVKDDGKSDLIVLGSDAVNAFSHAKIIEKVIPQFELPGGTDSYELISAKDTNSRQLLFIAGARPRAELYGVYRFFELRADCRYFWDGDIVPEAKTIDISGLNVKEHAHFQYRGLRYFAHRSLNRFQAEHWSFEEWKKEIDWILKKRMNFFMLRIGLDDLFQKAFPDIVSYPENYVVPEAVERSYDDRTLFWNLKYRGELRKKVLAYARERDLLHPEDIGTMTHWYSRTPLEYLKKVNPDFMPQATGGYGEKTGLVWDIRQDKNLDAYWKLTETHIREYGSPEIFHTIGLAERRCYEDQTANQQMKLYTYRRIIAKLRSHYPNAPLLIGSWDFAMHWTAEEVRELIREFDPSNTLLFDYTSDTDDESRTFQNWDLCGKFPWIYGIFHGYEPNSEPHGNYRAIARRLPVAAADPMCRGMVFWPENSHTDTLMLEFLAANAWDPCESNTEIRTFVEKFCAQRYQGKDVSKMLSLWKQTLPFIEARHWNGPGVRTDDYLFVFSECCFAPATLLNLTPRHYHNAEAFAKLLKGIVAEAPALLRKFAALDFAHAPEFVVRDSVDMIRSIAARSIHYFWSELILSIGKWRMNDCPVSELEKQASDIRKLMILLNAVLDSRKEYSLYDSLLDLQKKAKCNPKFEYTLKGNAENNYCRAFISELFSDVYIPEFDAVCKEMFRRMKNVKGVRNIVLKAEEVKKIRQGVQDAFYAKPLKKMAPNEAKAFRNLPSTLKQMAELIEKELKKEVK